MTLNFVLQVNEEEEKSDDQGGREPAADGKRQKDGSRNVLLFQQAFEPQEGEAQCPQVIDGGRGVDPHEWMHQQDECEQVGVGYQQNTANPIEGHEQ